MKVIVAAVIERADRRILIGQRRRADSSPLKWEFPGGKIEEGETPEAALLRRQHQGKHADANRVRTNRLGPSQRTSRLRFPRR